MGALLDGHQVFLLAAGHGRRAGGPKAWRLVDGTPALERHVAFLKRLLPGVRVSISIQAQWLARCHELDPAIRWVPVDPDLPAFASLVALVRDAPALAGWVYHVDMPLFETAVFERLARAAAASSAEAWVPAHEGRRGHPVLLSPALYPALRRLDPQKGRLDRFLSGRRVETIDVPWACVLENAN